jgi:hypothetical protein
MSKICILGHKQYAADRNTFFVPILSCLIHDVDMNELRKKILAKLKAHTEINTLGVKINVEDQRVFLIGLVDGEDAKATIEGLVESLSNDMIVINQLMIRKDNISGNQGIVVR